MNLPELSPPSVNSDYYTLTLYLYIKMLKDELEKVSNNSLNNVESLKLISSKYIESNNVNTLKADLNNFLNNTLINDNNNVNVNELVTGFFTVLLPFVNI